MAKTVEEIETEWRKIRPLLGNLICWIDGKVEQLQTLEDSYKKGLKDGESAAEADKSIAYQRGLEDAWEAAHKIHGEYTIAEMERLFDCDIEDVDCYFHPQEAIERLKEYEQREAEKSVIHLGDEVEAWDTNKWVKFIAICDNGADLIVGFDLDGGAYEYPKSDCRKTGGHYQVSHSKPQEKEGKHDGATDNHY